MRKLLRVVMLCALSLTAAVEALAWSEGASEPFGVIIAATRTKKKAPEKKAKKTTTSKKVGTPMSKISDKLYSEFYVLCSMGGDS